MGKVRFRCREMVKITLHFKCFSRVKNICWHRNTSNSAKSGRAVRHTGNGFCPLRNKPYPVCVYSEEILHQLLTSLFKKGLLGRDTMSNIEWDLSGGNPSPQAGALIPRGPHQWDFRSCSPNPPPISGLCVDSHSVRIMALQLNLYPPRPGLCLGPLTLRLHHHLLSVQLF